MFLSSSKAGKGFTLRSFLPDHGNRGDQYRYQVGNIQNPKEWHPKSTEELANVTNADPLLLVDLLEMPLYWLLYVSDSRREIASSSCLLRRSRGYECKLLSDQYSLEDLCRAVIRSNNGALVG